MTDQPERLDLASQDLTEDKKQTLLRLFSEIRSEDDKFLIVGVKSECERGHEIDGELGAKAIASRAWADLNPDRLNTRWFL